MAERVALPPVDHLTARPLLELLLAGAGHEAPYLPFDECWPAVRDFLALPAAHGAGGAVFQTELLSTSDEGVLYSIALAREVLDPPPPHAGDEPPWRRLVGVRWSYDLAALQDLSARTEVAGDRGPDEFIAFLETLPEWQFAQVIGAVHAEVFAEDLDEEGDLEDDDDADPGAP